MLKRLTSVEACKEITDRYPDYFTFDAEAWFVNPKNWACVEGLNAGFAEWKSDGNYWVHLCCHEARGRAAVELTKRMVRFLCEDTNLRTAVALISVENRKACWLIRQVGFKSLGLVDSGNNGICEMFFLTGEDYNSGI